jgi:hypothetical protein
MPAGNRGSALLNTNEGSADVIVVPAGDGALLITQPDHAHLARALMERCVPLAASPRRDEILRAIGEHDNGWIEDDAAPTVNLDTGGITDFVIAPIAVRHEVWPRGVARLSNDPWAAALVAEHALTIYDRYRTAPEWQGFFARMEGLRDEVVRHAGRSLAELVEDYPYVRLADLVSLAFCTRTAEVQRIGEWTVSFSDPAVLVDPYPFVEPEIPIAIAARRIEGRTFASNVELRTALAAAPAVTLRGKLAPAY